ncbi:nitroreductase family protein [Pectinatus cerevisiiphilus]|uniref:Nitroreductase n=1 Tax=Pectinatus cerevisiiphilus TaxID=86956 RepID=A0A4R3K3T0_9FIRM|nr:nitroreductase family protein [Pectinatus cerevisiiphilus]TCS77346.1 nitroreductase [Pectinatus cerevisiiphilus]
MELITVDQKKCIQCGICIKECPSFVLSMGKNGPQATAPQSCIACGHCVAVCPRAAIDHKKTPLANQLDLADYPKLTATESEVFLRSRRSIRSYLKKAVPREDLLKLVNIARFAPTASNSQGVSYVIIDDREILDTAVKIVIERLENDKVLKQIFAHYLNVYYEKGIDVVLRNAPSLILSTADINATRGRENSIFSLAYLELYAPTLGLGSCWAGILEVLALELKSPLLKLFHIPEGRKITGAVMVGYPQYKYKRLVDRNPLVVSFYEKNND